MRDALEDSIERLLSDQVTPALLRKSEQDGLAIGLWNVIEENGFTRALVSEDGGGSGLSWGDVYPLVVAAGRHALPLPLPETMLAAWLLDRAGIDVPSGPLTIADTTGTSDASSAAPLRASLHGNLWRIDGLLPLVPWARSCTNVACEVWVDGLLHIALVPLADVKRRDDMNLAREPRDTLELRGTPALAVQPIPAELGPSPIRLYGAMLRAAQMAGAMERLLQQSVQYAGDRVQFGKPIAKFQAIQQQLAVLGCEWAATSAGSAFAFEQAETAAAQLAIAAAKVRASEAAGKAASIAHATHGAIGFTYEHTLHFSTRRLWSWRSEFGHHAWWSRRIGAAVCASDTPFWEGVTSGNASVLSFPTSSSANHAAETA